MENQNLDPLKREFQVMNENGVTATFKAMEEAQKYIGQMGWQRSHWIEPKEGDSQ